MSKRLSDAAGSTLPLLVGAAALLVAGYFSLGIGALPLSPMQLLRPTSTEWTIISQSRLPRLAAVMLAGSALAVAGLVMQRITQSRFVSPSTSGTVESAILGIVIASLFFGEASLVAKMSLAIGFSLLGSFGFLRLMRSLRQPDGVLVALVGVMYGGVIGALATYLAYRYDLIQLLETWTTGSFSGVQEGRYELLYVVAGVTVAAYLLAHRFTVAGLGRSLATGLGMHYGRTLGLGVLLASTSTAVVVAVVGAIPFLGLIVPNVVSLLLGDDVRRVLPVTALGGAGFVLACDVAGRVVRFPYEVPASTIAGIVGAIVFIVLILRSARTAAP